MPVAAVSMKVLANQITYFARQNLLEHGWRHALRLVLEEVPGLSTDQAIQLFKGEKCFIDDLRAGPGNILFVDDPDSSEWRSELEEKYGTTCKIDDRYYRPYGYVTDYGPHDSGTGSISERLYVSKEMQALFDDYPYAFDGSNTGDFEKRAMHYASAPNDKAVKCFIALDGDLYPLVVLFEESDEPPYWSEIKKPQEAVDAARDELHVLGFQVSYGSSDLASEKDTERMTEQAKFNFTAVGLRNGLKGLDVEAKLQGYLQSLSEATPEHYEARRGRILEQNDGMNYGYRKVDFGPSIGFREVPNGPLIKWALNRGRAMKDAGPDWDAVSMSGLKQAGDDPVHTDWVTGAGLEGEDFSKEPLKSIQNELAATIQQEQLGFSIHVLVAGKAQATGVIKHCTRYSEVDKDTVAVVANASIHFERIAREAAAVIVLEGGAMSHLAVNGLEMGQIIIRDPEAKKHYPEGTTIQIDVESGRIFRLAEPHVAPEAEETPSPKGM